MYINVVIKHTHTHGGVKNDWVRIAVSLLDESNAHFSELTRKW